MISSKYNNSGFVQCSTPKGYEQMNKPFSHLSICSIEQTEQMNKRKKLLDLYSTKQIFRVAIGKSTWVEYKQFDEKYNLREILNDEIVIELDSDDKNLVTKAIRQTCINLSQANLIFELWDHGGRSPHIHIHNLPITQYSPDQRKKFKELFIKRYVPKEYLKFVDLSLTGVHLIALEYAPHWKGSGRIKKPVEILSSEYDPIPCVLVGDGLCSCKEKAIFFGLQRNFCKECYYKAVSS